MRELHQPVLLQEVLKFFSPLPGDEFIDATFGRGGHSLAILKKISPAGRILGIDWTPKLLKRKVWKEKKGLVLATGNFKNLKAISQAHGFNKVKGILLDLGLSSWHLERSGQGFSFQKDEPLQMIFSRENDNSISAQEIINTWNSEQLENLFRQYGEEPRARSVAALVAANRPIKTTEELARLLSSPKEKARIFQSLRIFINNELENLKHVLPQAMALAERVAVISYHSLEDRIVKQAFGNRILIRPSPEEIQKNSRSRSAKLRLFVSK